MSIKRGSRPTELETIVLDRVARNEDPWKGTGRSVGSRLVSQAIGRLRRRGLVDYGYGPDGRNEQVGYFLTKAGVAIRAAASRPAGTRIRYYLTTSSYVGLDPRASHYYARVRWCEPGSNGKQYLEEDLEYVERRSGVEIPLRSFDSEEDAIEFARGWFRERAGVDDVLVLGSHASICPKPILAGPAELIARADPILARYLVAYPEEADRAIDPRAADRETDAWEALFEGYS